MTNSTVNYTDQMVEIIKAQQPLDLAKAKALGLEFNKGYRSIIAKAKKEGFEYISKPAPAKKKAQPLKIDIIMAIASALDVTANDLIGLEKATGQGLNNLLKSIR